MKANGMLDYYDRTLIRLKRQYSKDETVAALSKKLMFTEIKVGVLKDEIECLKDEIECLKDEINQLKNKLQVKNELKEVNKLARVDIQKEKIFNDILKKHEKMGIELKRVKEQRDELITKMIMK